MPKSRLSNEEIDVDTLDDESDKAKLFVKDVYQNINTLYGVFDPNHGSKALRGLLICVFALFIATPFGVVIWNLIAHKLNWWVNLVLVAFGIIFGGFAINFLKDYLSKQHKAYVYFYKIGDKTITIYKQIKGKHITIYLSKKKIFRQYSGGDWQEIKYDEDEMMGSNLLFSKLRQNLDQDLYYDERKNALQIVYVYNKELLKKTTVMKVKEGVLQSIEHCKLSYDNEAKLRINAADLLNVLEVNTMRSCDIPKSFLEFCDSNGIDFPKENEHLRYT